VCCASAPIHLLHSWGISVYLLLSWQLIQIKPPQILQAYSDYVGGINMSNVVMYAWIDEWMGCEILEEYMFQLTEFSTVFLNSYHCIRYKKNIIPGTKLISCVDFSVYIIESLGNERFLEKNNSHRSEIIMPGKCLWKLLKKKMKFIIVCVTEGQNMGRENENP
jgi:hypothetical protein